MTGRARDDDHSWPDVTGIRAGRTAPRALRPPRRSARAARRPSASSTCCAFVAPTIGAVTPGLVPQPGERELRARDAALGGHLGDALDDRKVGLGRVERRRRTDRSSTRVGQLLGARAVARRAARAPAGSTAAPRRPGRRTAGSSPAPPRGRPGCSGSASRRTASSRARRRRPGPWRTARRTCCSPRCSAPCPPSPRRAAPPSSPRSASSWSKRWIW